MNVGHASFVLVSGAGFVSVRGYGMHDATHKEWVAHRSVGVFFSLCSCFAQDAAGVVEKSMDQKIDEWFGKVTAPFVNAVFSTINVGGYKALWVIFGWRRRA